MSNEERAQLAKQLISEVKAEYAAADRIANDVVRRVCELPDYNSPDDQPNLVMCTAEQLHLCVMRALGQDV